MLKWRDRAINRRIAKVRTRSDGIVCQNKVSASLESAVMEDLSLDTPECADWSVFLGQAQLLKGDIMESIL